MRTRTSAASDFCAGVRAARGDGPLHRAEKLESHAKEWSRRCLRTNTKVNATWMKDKNLRAKMIKFIEQKVGVNLYDFGFTKDMAPKA